MKEDTISRQMAIKALAKEMPSLTTPDGTGQFDHDIQIAAEAFVDAMQIINDLPPAQPERIRGKWQWLASTYDRTPCEMRFRCSVCHHETITHGSDPWEKFCPNCGANMRETDGSED